MDLFEMPLNPNKRLREEFVSNLTGSSMLEIAALSTIVPALIVIRKSISSDRGNAYEQEAAAKKDKNVNFSHKSWRDHAFSLSMDFVCVILPVLLVFTVLSEWCYEFTILVILLMCLLFAFKRYKFGSKVEPRHSSFSYLRTVISSYRVSVVVITCLCILAVDFKIFPRRYAKTETYGTGLMDIGVGSFVVANSLVSKQARNLHSMNWKTALKSTSPLVLLGFGRLISTTGVDYQVHVGEYGVHWNFFFTLASVSILTSLIPIRPKFCGILGLVVLTGYQMLLVFGLNDYLLSNERKADLISQNKEGLFSIFGYWGMYLIGVYLGHQLLYNNHSSSKNNGIQFIRVKLWVLSAFFWLLTIFLDNYVERVSRRMCNFSYVTIVFAQNFQVISVLTLADNTVSNERNLLLEEAFNQNLLGSFLLANILTGIVNLTVDTLSASVFTALIILFGYSFILCAFVSLAWFFGIRVKFW